MAVHSRITFERTELTFAFVHLGGRRLVGGVRPFGPGHLTTLEAIERALQSEEPRQLLRRIEYEFEGNLDELSTLLPDQRQRLERLIDA